MWWSHTVLAHAFERTHLVIRNLLQVKVGGIHNLHSAVAVVCAAEGAPVFGVWIEPVRPLSAALWEIQW